MQNRYADLYLFFRVLVQLQLPDFFSAASRYQPLNIVVCVLQEFSSYSAYRQHVESVCEARVVACHICGKTFISVARLNTHVQALGT
jgi:hypothetical protein